MDIAPFIPRRTRDDRHQSCLLRKHSSAGAARLPIEPDYTAFKARFQRLSYVNASESVAIRLELKHLRTDHHFRLTPVGAHSDRLRTVVEDVFGLIGKSTKHNRIGTAEPHLHTSATARTQHKLLSV